MLTRESTTTEVIAWAAQQNWPAGTVIEQVGDWVWIEFAQRPARSVLDLLHPTKSAEQKNERVDTGWRWISKRCKWAHPCGHPTFGHCKHDPRDNHGVQFHKVVEQEA